MLGTFLFSTDHTPEWKEHSVLQQSTNALLTPSLSLSLFPSN